MFDDSGSLQSLVLTQSPVDINSTFCGLSFDFTVRATLFQSFLFGAFSFFFFGSRSPKPVPFSPLEAFSSVHCPLPDKQCARLALLPLLLEFSPFFPIAYSASLQRALSVGTILPPFFIFIRGDPLLFASSRAQFSFSFAMFAMPFVLDVPTQSFARQLAVAPFCVSSPSCRRLSRPVVFPPFSRAFLRWWVGDRWSVFLRRRLFFSAEAFSRLP